jgi:hypothetical protein
MRLAGNGEVGEVDIKGGKEGLVSGALACSGGVCERGFELGIREGAGTLRGGESELDLFQKGVERLGKRLERIGEIE